MRTFCNILLLLFAITSKIPAQDSLKLELKVFLEGAFINGRMEPTLNIKNLLPLEQPFHSSPWDYDGKEKVTEVPLSIIDWVLIELQNDLESPLIITRRAAFLKQDGMITDLDGSSGLLFDDNISEGNYYVVIKHRNHLPVISSFPINPSAATGVYDFSKDPENYNGSMTIHDSGLYSMCAGDGDLNGIIDTMDCKVVAYDIFQTGYLRGDFDMNGVVNVLDYAPVNKNLHKTTQVPQ
jgi:hypothetical protein